MDIEQHLAESVVREFVAAFKISHGLCRRSNRMSRQRSTSDADTSFAHNDSFSDDDDLATCEAMYDYAGEQLYNVHCIIVLGMGIV